MVGVPSPQPAARDVRLDSTIRLPFTRPMDRASVEAGLTFTPALEVDLAWEGDTLVVTPRGGLAGDTAYEVRLSAEVRDETRRAAGRALPLGFRALSPFCWTPSVPSGAGRPRASAAPRPGLCPAHGPGQRGSRARHNALAPPASLPGATTTGPSPSSPIPPGCPAPTMRSRCPARRAPPTARSGWARTAPGASPPLSRRSSSARGRTSRSWTLPAQRAVQLIFQGADVADFRLYPITPTQFLDLYSSGFRGIGPDEAQTLDAAGLEPAAEWRQVLTPLDEESYYYDWQAAEITLPADVPAGLYILSTDPPAEDQGQLLVVLTEHGLVLKRALAGTGTRTQAQIVAWDTEISGGAPVVSATVRLYDRDGAFLAEGLTGADGLLTLDVPGDPGPLLALSDAGGDVTVCGLGNEWSESGWWWWWTEPAQPLPIHHLLLHRPAHLPPRPDGLL